MRSNIVSEAGVTTRLAQWWQGIPFLTSSVVITCGFIYSVCLLIGYDSFVEICFLPSAIITQFQVYRMYTAIFFHASVLHVLFNMMALVPLGSELERIMGSIRMLFAVFLLASSNAILHLFIAIVVAHNPFHHEGFFMNECGIGFSGILFSMIVIETSLNGVQSRSVFGLFNVPAKWYAWILLIVFQLLMTNVSLLGHLCGILSGFAYTNGLFNSVMPGSSFLSSIEALSLLSSCVRQPKFILCSGGNSSGYIPTFSSPNSSVVYPGNILRNISSWFPQREISEQPTEDNLRFPGQGRVLGSTPNQRVPDDSSLQTTLLDGSNPVNPSDSAPVSRGNAVSDERKSDGVAAAAVASNSVDDQAENTRQLVSMGFEKTQVEVALAASDGDLGVAVEILMSQQG